MAKTTAPKRIVCIGGGTGTFVVLRGLKSYPFHLSAIVTMSDSGGSNKRLRDEFGLLPTSDIRQAFVALSHENGGGGLLRKLFMYRFQKGRGIRGMTFGNLFMAALSDILGSQEEAIRQTGKVLRIHGTVIPVSFTDTNLYATYEDGHTVSEEHLIDEPVHDGRLRITKAYLKPEARANGDAIKAIESADLVVLGPGDLYTSVIPNLLVSGMGAALKRTKAKIVYVVNLMTKYGQTYNFGASDHIRVLETFIGPSIDYVILNKTAIPKRALEVYAKAHEQPVADDIMGKTAYRVIREDVAGSVLIEQAKSDTLVRSLIRHDSEKLAAVLATLL
ncbi:YvcK family protein [Candidatus Gottesmanbacteria bacterium]|nr:YvcK family protein [Candidatus Gottesmanbacteria bacterium]